jgi:type IV fimbrial biogenesis protein FimT
MLSMLLNRRQRGVSLIELMVGIAILGILAALALPSYTAWIQNTKIRTAAESIQNGLQIARAEAVKRNTPVQFVLGASSAWTVSCVTAAQCADLTDGVIQTREASEGSSAEITIVTDDTSTLVFTRLGLVDTTLDTFTQVDIDSDASAADRPLRVTIGVGGNTKMCDPDSGLSASDPRKC